MVLESTRGDTYLLLFHSIRMTRSPFLLTTIHHVVVYSKRLGGSEWTVLLKPIGLA